MSALTAYELKKVPVQYVIVDKNHFLRKIDQLNDSGKLRGKNVTHVSIDVVNMFPNIPREFGIAECTKHLSKRTKPHLFSTSCIVEALKITLDNNLATFNGKCYLQLTGTAMGPKNACDYADVAMNFIDQAVHNSNPDTRHNQNVPEDWNRYRDDVYVPWTGTLEQLNQFMDWLNSIHPSLKFTMSHSADGIEFLDLYVYANEDGILQTRMYSKPSDTHCYLVPTSCHKTHIVENIPYNTARRVLINNSETQNYQKDKELYSKYLAARGYNPEFVTEAFIKAEKLNRSSLYAVKVDKENENKLCLPMVMDTNPSLPNMSKIINKYKNLLELDPKLSKIIPSTSIFVSHRSAKTLKDLLISSKLPMQPQLTNSPLNTISSNNIADSNSSLHSLQIDNQINMGNTSCNKCYLCKNYLEECDHFTSYHTKQIFKHRNKLTCDTECIVYMIECKTHKISYTGYTITNMKTRFSNNKSHIKNKNASCEFVKHFIESEHSEMNYTNRNQYDISLSKHVKVTLVEKVDVEPTASREQKEKKCEEREGYWQTQLKTLRAYGGLNVRDNRKYVSRRAQEKHSRSL